MRLVKKIVGSATKNTLLQLDRVILICSITGLVLDVLAVFLVFQSDTKKWGSNIISSSSSITNSYSSFIPTFCPKQSYLSNVKRCY